MSLPRDFEKTVAATTDEDLFDMLGHEADYMPEAFAAVRAEAARRNLSTTRVLELEKHSQHIRTQELKTSSEVLSFGGKFLVLLFPFGLVTCLLIPVIAESYRNRGYKQKSEDCLVGMWYGIIFWAVFWVVFFFLRLTFQFAVLLSVVFSATAGVVAALGYFRSAGNAQRHPDSSHQSPGEPDSSPQSPEVPSDLKDAMNNLRRRGYVVKAFLARGEFEIARPDGSKHIVKTKTEFLTWANAEMDNSDSASTATAVS